MSEGDEKLTRDQQRSRRDRKVRALTLYVPRYPKAVLEHDRQLYPEDPDVERPRTRDDCISGPRPCPFVSCRHHLYLDVSPKGSIKLNFPDLEVWEMEHSCSLDVADEEKVLEVREVGQLINITRERVRQLVWRSSAKMADLLGLTSKPQDEDEWDVEKKDQGLLLQGVWKGRVKNKRTRSK